MCELSFSRTEFTIHWGFRSKAPHRLKLWVERHLLRLIATWCRLVPSQKDPSRGEWSIFTTKDGVDGFASGTDRENTSTFRLYLYTSRKRRPLQIIEYQLHNDNSGMCVDTYCYLQRSFLNVNEKKCSTSNIRSCMHEIYLNFLNFRFRHALKWVDSVAMQAGSGGWQTLIFSIWRRVVMVTPVTVLIAAA